jgi:4'-phosphopantetheinyl transferase
MPVSADVVWAPGPSRPLLVDGALHVWRADLKEVPEDLGNLLCTEERERAERMVDERNGELWRRSRGLLRALLGRYLQRDPSSLRFSTGEHGKPALADDASPTVDFNMSHSGQLALYAFSAAGAVGVDVEVARRPADEVAIAARVLGASEAARLQALDPAARRREFLRAWTRYEAELKCLGIGIGGTDGVIEGTRPWVAYLEPGQGAAGAVAAARPPRELRCWGWAAIGHAAGHGG